MSIFYLVCLIVGGIFVFLAAFGGLDGIDFDNDFDADIDVKDESQGEKTPRKPIWLPFLSFKFWTFGVCFFGLTGVLLNWLQPNLSQPITAIASATVGLICGTAVAWLLHSLRHDTVNSLIAADDLVGLSGTVEVPFDVNSRGKVRLEFNGSAMDLIAFTQESRQFSRGEKVFVVGMEENRVWVVSEDALSKS